MSALASVFQSSSQFWIEEILTELRRENIKSKAIYLLAHGWMHDQTADRGSLSVYRKVFFVS